MGQWLNVLLCCAVLSQVTACSHNPKHHKHAKSSQDTTQSASTSQVSDHLKHQIQAQVEKILPHHPINTLKDSPVPGLYEVTAGPMVFYASQDGRYLVMGDILDTSKEGEDRSLTEVSRRSARAVLFKSLKGQSLVSYKPETVKAVLTVFVDPDCGYCKKLHEEIPALLASGIRVDYLAFPRQGVGSPTFDKLVGVWCASDPNAAMDKIMKDESIEPGTCKNRVEEEYLLGRQLGVNGTPSMIFPDGTLSVGYRPAKDLEELALKHYHPAQ